MASASLTTLAAAFKKVYSTKAIQDLSAADRPFYGMVPKSNDFYGESFKCYVNYGKPQGRSRTFSNAQAQTTASSGVGFEVTRVGDYGLIHLDRESVEAAEKDLGAFFRIKSHEQKLMLDNMAENIWEGLFDDGDAYKATVGSISTTSLVLSDEYDIGKFELGMELMGYNSGTARTGSATVTGINRDTYTLTTDSNWTAQITSLTAGDTLAVAGDKGLGMSGLKAWIPATAPTSGDSHFGVDRSVDAVRLGGMRYDGSDYLISEALTKALHRARRHRARGIKYCIVNPEQYGQLSLELDNKAEYCKDPARGEAGKQIGNIGYEGIYFNSPYGRVKVYADEMCGGTTAWLLNMDTWDLKTLKGAPRMLVSHVRDSTDEMEIRNVANLNLMTNAPGWNMNVTLAAVA